MLAAREEFDNRRRALSAAFADIRFVVNDQDVGWHGVRN
jgi:hypothetical protein